MDKGQQVKITISADPSALQKGVSVSMSELNRLGKGYEALRKTQNKLDQVKDFAALKKGAEEARVEWQQATDKVSALAREIRVTEKPSRALTTNFEAAKRSAAALKGQYSEATAALEQARRALKQSGIDSRDVATANQRLTKSYADLRREALANTKINQARGLLDIRPHREIRREISKLQASYARLKRSGQLSLGELYQAKRKLTAQTRVLNAEMGRNGSYLLRWANQVKGIVGAYIGMHAVVRSLSAVTDITNRASTANFNLEASVSAARREFDNTGSIDHWQVAAARLSKEMRIYSETAVKTAISRTIDMTKRLGLSADQMEEVIRRTADLSAGRTDLVGGIERTTAALRGEAESAEYLGLTLNENYVKSWYEAHKVHGLAWKDLNDLEKAQARYQVFMEQSTPMAGRAANSVNTLDGAWQLMTSTLDNAIANNADVRESLMEIADVIRESAPDLAQFASELAGVIATIVKFTVENKALVATLIGGAGTFFAVSRLAGAVANLKAGLDLIKAGRLIEQLRTLGTASATSCTSMAGLTAAVVVFAAIELTQAVNEYIKMRDAIKEAEAAHKRLMEGVDDVLKSYDKFKDFRLPDLTGKAPEQLKDLRAQLAKTHRYWTNLVIDLQDRADRTKNTIWGKQAAEDLAKAKGRLQEVKDELGRVNAALHGTGQASQQVGRIGQEVYKALAEEAKQSYEEQLKAAEKWAQKVIDLDEQIRRQRMSTEDKLRDLAQKGMTESQRYADNQSLAGEKQAGAKAELAAAQAAYLQAQTRRNDASRAMADLQVALAEGDAAAVSRARAAAQEATRQAEQATAATEQHFARAQELAGQAESAYSQLATEVKSGDRVVVSLRQGVEAARSGVAAVGQLQEQILQAQKAQAAGFAQAALQAANGAQQAFGQFAHQQMEVTVDTPNLDQVREQLAALAVPVTKTVTVRYVEQHAAGGPAGGYVRMSRGGRLPGTDSKIDKVPVLARPGEWFIRNEAAAAWTRTMGSGFMHAINAPWSDAGRRLMAGLRGFKLPRVSVPRVTVPSLGPLRFATGGAVPGGAAVPMGTINLAIGGDSIAVSAPVSDLDRLNQMIKRARRTS